LKDLWPFWDFLALQSPLSFDLTWEIFWGGILSVLFQGVVGTYGRAKPAFQTFCMINLGIAIFIILGQSPSGTRVSGKATVIVNAFVFIEYYCHMEILT
jgi:uncharacterized membrane protein YedE/YeeE